MTDPPDPGWSRIGPVHGTDGVLPPHGAWQIDVPLNDPAAVADGVFLRLRDYPVAGAFSDPEGPYGPLAAGGETELALLAFTLAHGCVARTVEVPPGFSLVAYTGGDGSDIEIVNQLAGNPFHALFDWDADTQTYRAWRAALPAGLNQITTLDFGHAVWLLGEAAVNTDWTQPVRHWDARSLPLAEGWTLVAWTGPNNTDVFAAFSPQAFGAQTIVQSPFLAALTYDNETKRFRTFDTRLPEALNDFTTLTYGDPVWIQLVAPLHWQVPAPGPEDPCDEG